ncbi:MAG: glycosyltransferase family 2 protein [Acidobacteria bacterium]|nr:glycosyltransferase family 2 protein [Acidobacteriota bacterium]
MNKEPEVSIVISTYNRCSMLPSALECVLAQKSGDVSYEVIVVDNNSTDKTREVVESFLERAKVSLRYIFEEKQGLSHARNAGITAARAPIVAFTDDDIYVSPDWVTNIKRIFDKYPEAGCIGGKVLPQWSGEPPSWLTDEHWAPLALQDHGDAPFYVDTKRQICLVGANLAFRREVFEQVGVFAPELQRVKGSIGSMEDAEFEYRYFQSGGKGLYEPSLTVSALVESERLQKAYHRKWHTGHGQFYAVYRDEEVEHGSRRLFGVPAHMYRQFMVDAVHCLKHSLQRSEAKAFQRETQLRFFTGFIRRRRQEFLASAQNRNSIGEIVSFICSLAARKPNDKRFEKI